MSSNSAEGAQKQEGKVEFPEMELFRYQEKAFADLLSTACVLFGGRWWELPVKPRFNVLVAGGTGLGKTALVRAVARTLEIPVYEVSTATWILTGAVARGAAATWPSLLHFLLSHRLGLIFIDEIDKLSGEWEWTRYLRSEIFALLDRTLPANLILRSEEPVQESSLGPPGTPGTPRFSRRIAEIRLKHGMLIVAAGAFQEIWEQTATASIGFAIDRRPKPHAPDVGTLAKYLPRELVTRFRAKLVVLGPLRFIDYVNILHQTVKRLPAELQERFLERGYDSAMQAFETRLGVRWLEELMTETLIEESDYLTIKHRQLPAAR